MTKRSAYFTYGILLAGGACFFFLRSWPIVALVFAFALGTLSATKSLKSALFAYVAIVPIIHPVVSVEIAGLPLLTYGRILLAGILCVAIAKREMRGFTTVPALALFIAFMISLSITAMLSDDPKSNFNSVFFYLVECLFLVTLLSQHLTADTFTIIIRLLFASYAVALAVALVEIAYGNSLFMAFINENSKVNLYVYEDFQNRVGGLRRIYSLFEHPFAFANFASLVSVFMLGLYFVERKSKYIVLFASTALPVLFSFSRASLILWITMAFSFLMLYGAESRRWVRKALPIFVCVAVIVIFGTAFKEYFTQYFSTESIVSEESGSSLSTRLDEAANSMAYLSNRIPFGFGEKTVNESIKLGEFIGIGFVESNLVRKALSFGAVGTLLWFLFHLKVFRMLLSRMRLDEADLRLRVYIVAACAIVIGFFEHSIHSGMVNEQLVFILIVMPLLVRSRSTA